KVDPNMPIYEMKTLEGQLDETLSTERLGATLSSAFGTLATLLAALGLYGVMAFSVVRRTRELAIRIALGAPRGGLLWLVMRELLVVLGAGLVIGIPAVYWLSRYVGSQLFLVSPGDPMTAITAGVLLVLTAMAAGFIPAHRASRVNPLTAL